MSEGFGMIPLKAEGKPAHPDGFGVGWDNGDKSGTDQKYLRQLQAYADWHGVAATKTEMCSRPWLLEKLEETK